MPKKLFIILIAAIFGFLGFNPARAQENKNPGIGEIIWEQLHKSYEEVPHKYTLNYEMQQWQLKLNNPKTIWISQI